MNFRLPSEKIKEKLNGVKQQLPKKPMMIMVLVLAVFFGLIFTYKSVMNHFMMQYIKKSAEPAVTVSAMSAQYQDWMPRLKASGSLRAVLGVDVTTEIAGLVRTVDFKPGSEVLMNDLLVELNIDSEKAQLASLEATLELSKITYDRDKAQFEAQAVSKATLDTDAANLKSNGAQVDEQKAVIAKKIIRAPFSGRLGISLVYPGQYVNPGDKIVTLQSLDPIYVDFYVPQQSINDVAVGREVILSTDTYPGKTFKGIITTVNPKVDDKTRNVEVEATIENPEHTLFPGMFGNVEVNTGSPKKFLTLPQTAITYNPYGDIIYIIEEDKQKNKKGSKLSVKQTFVKVGEVRGDQVAIISGINEGDRVVTSGQMKLKNGSTILINNNVVPSFEANPNPPDEE